MSYAQASTLPIAALTAYHCLFGFERTLQPGQTLLVEGMCARLPLSLRLSLNSVTLPPHLLTSSPPHLPTSHPPLPALPSLPLGTGGVSLAALQFALISGARPIVISSSDAKLARCRALGVAERDLINYKTTPEWPEKVRELTGGRGVDHTVRSSLELGSRVPLRSIWLSQPWLALFFCAGRDRRTRYARESNLLCRPIRLCLDRRRKCTALPPASCLALSLQFTYLRPGSLAICYPLHIRARTHAHARSTSTITKSLARGTTRPRWPSRFFTLRYVNQ